MKGTVESEVSGSGDLVPATDEDITVSSVDASKTIESVDVSTNDQVAKGAQLLTFTDGTTLDAPSGGTITKVNVTAGNKVTAGRAVMHLTNYSDLNTIVQVDELDIPKIKVGQSVSVIVNAYPNKKFSGKVTAIAQQGTDTNGVSTFDVTVNMDNSSGLKAGMTTTANIVLKKRTNVLYLPSGAVHQTGSQSFVYLSSDTPAASTQQNRFTRRSSGMDQQRGRLVTVKTGIHSDQSIEITSGLTAGQTVQLTAITRQSGTNTTTANSQNAYQMMSGSGGQGTNAKSLRRMLKNGGGSGQ